ncbi:MAG: TetR/AcrR family transcriptional regulator [Tepidiformaceae bacterium]
MTQVPESLAPGSLQQRKARTRAAIVQAATDLFRRQGYEETSIQQIAELADTGVGTLYGYFAAKEELLREVLKSRSDAAFQSYFAAVDQSTGYVERVVTAMRVLAGYIRDNRLVLAAEFQTAARDRKLDAHWAEMLTSSFAQLLTTGIERGEIAPLPVETTARVLIGTCTMATLGIGVWDGRDGDQSLADVETITRHLLGASL